MAILLPSFKKIHNVLVNFLMYIMLCPGSGYGPAGGAAAGLGRGYPGWGSCCAMGETVVPWSSDGWHHYALPVSPLHCALLCQSYTQLETLLALHTFSLAQQGDVSLKSTYPD